MVRTVVFSFLRLTLFYGKDQGNKRRNDEDFNRGGKEVFLFASKALGGG
jgi:hypothetical protein